MSDNPFEVLPDKPKETMVSNTANANGERGRAAPVKARPQGAKRAKPRVSPGSPPTSDAPGNLPRDAANPPVSHTTTSSLFGLVDDNPFATPDDNPYGVGPLAAVRENLPSISPTLAPADSRPASAAPARRGVTFWVTIAVVVLALSGGVFGTLNKLLQRARQANKGKEDGANPDAAEVAQRPKRAEVMPVALVVNKEVFSRQRQLVEPAFEPGWKLCQNGSMVEGLLQWSQQLDQGTPAANHLLRANLRAWRSHLLALRGVFEEQDPIVSMAVSPDGQFVLIGTEKSGWIWGTRENRPLTAALLHTGSVTAVAIHPQMRSVATGSADGTVKIWRPTTGLPLFSPLEHLAAIQTVAYSPDGELLLTVANDRKARLWSARNGSPKVKLPALDLTIRWAGFSPDGNRIALITEKGATLFDSLTGDNIREFTLPDAQTAAFSADGKRLVVGGGKTARLWNLSSGNPIGQPMVHRTNILGVKFDPSGRRIIIATEGEYCKWWNADNANAIPLTCNLKGRVEEVSFSPDGTLALLALDDMTARVIDLYSGKQRGNSLAHDAAIVALGINGQNNTIATACADQIIRVCEVPRENALAALTDLNEPVRAVASSARGNVVAVAGNQGTLKIFAMPRRQLYASPRVEFPLVSLQVSNNGGWLASGTDRAKVILWSLSEDQPSRRTINLEGRPTAIGFTANSKTLAVASEVTVEGTAVVRFWDCANAEPHFLTLSHPETITCMAFRPETSVLATGCTDGNLRFWDSQTGKRMGKSIGLGDKITTIAYSSNGALMATGTESGKLRLWDSGNGEKIGNEMNIALPITALAFCAEGNSLAVGSGNENSGKLQFFETTSFLPIGPPLYHPKAVTSIALCMRDMAVTACSDSTARAWQVPIPMSGDSIQLSSWLQVLTARELGERNRVQKVEWHMWHERRRRLLETLGDIP